MSEFKEPKIGDKIVIPEGFTLVGFGGDYKRVYEVADFFFDNKHGMHFITFEADGRNYTFPPAAFDKASEAEIKAGHRIDNCTACNGRGEVGNILDGDTCPCCKGSGVELETLDKPENHISLNCKVEDV